MRRIILFALVLALTVTPCHALTLFKADYDGDSYTTERVAFDYPSVTCGDSSPDKGSQADWLPLRELSKILSYEVEWKDSTIYIYAERTWEIKPDRYLPEGVMIRDGVTYVSPAYMKRLVPNNFLFRTELYVFAGEIKRSALVRGEEDFREEVITAMYRLRLALPEDYRLIRDCLTGGIEQSAWQDWMPEGALSYVYPGHKHPTAHIIAGRRANLTELIAHEAHHVWEYYHGGIDEAAAAAYGKKVKAGVGE